jgi:hypothetical protein
MLLWGGGRGACGAVRAVQVSSIGWPATACMGVWERGAATGPSALTLMPAAESSGRGPSAAAAWRHGRPRHGVSHARGDAMMCTFAAAQLEHERDPRWAYTASVHRTALVHRLATLGERVVVGPFCTIGPEVRAPTPLRTRLCRVRNPWRPVFWWLVEPPRK